MCADQSSKRKTHVPTERPPFDRVALMLQGGGALGAYQAGVYQALAEAGFIPTGSPASRSARSTAAIIAGNPPEKRVENLRVLGNRQRRLPLQCLGLHVGRRGLRDRRQSDERLVGVLAAEPGFFRPRPPTAWSHPPGARGGRASMTLGARSEPRSSASSTSTASIPARSVSALARSTSAPAISSISTARRIASARACDGQRRAAARVSRRPRSRASTIGTAACLEYAHFSGWLDTRRGRTRSLFSRPLERARRVPAQPRGGHDPTEGDPTIRAVRAPATDHFKKQAAAPSCGPAKFLAKNPGDATANYPKAEIRSPGKPNEKVYHL